MLSVSYTIALLFLPIDGEVKCSLVLLAPVIWLFEFTILRDWIRSWKN